MLNGYMREHFLDMSCHVPVRRLALIGLSCLGSAVVGQQMPLGRGMPVRYLLDNAQPVYQDQRPAVRRDSLTSDLYLEVRATASSPVPVAATIRSRTSGLTRKLARLGRLLGRATDTYYRISPTGDHLLWYTGGSEGPASVINVARLDGTGRRAYAVVSYFCAM